MAVVNLSKKDIGTVANIIVAKAMEMRKRGSQWRRGEEYLSWVQMVDIANKIGKSINIKYGLNPKPSKKS